MAANRAVFFDRDDTLIHDDDGGYIGDPAKVRLIRGAASAVASLRQLGYHIIVVSNQSGVARGYFTEREVDAVHARVAELVHHASGGVIDRFYYCPFHPDGSVESYCSDHPWRKPQPGMLLQAAADLKLNLEESWMVGNAERDVEAGIAGGCQTVLISRERATTTSAHFVATTIGEAAAIIAQNRVRRRELVPPSPIAVVSKRGAQNSARTATTARRRKASETVADELDRESRLESQADERGQPSKHTSSQAKTSTAIEALDTEINGDAQKSDEGETQLAGPVETAEAEDERNNDLDAVEEVAACDAASSSPLFGERDPEAIEREQIDIAAAVGANTRESAELSPAPSSSVVEVAHEWPRRQGPRLEVESVDQPSRRTPPSSSRSADERIVILLTDLLSEFRSWRHSRREFTPIRMTVMLLQLAILLFAVGVVLYLDPSRAILWLGVALLTQLTVIGFLLLSDRA